MSKFKSKHCCIPKWMIVVGFTIGISLLAMIILPYFVKARATDSLGPSGHCINNLRQIDAAANQFAFEHNLTNGAPIRFPDDLTPFIKLNSAGKIPPCPAGGVYRIVRVGEAPTCTMSSLTPAHVLWYQPQRGGRE